MEDDVKSSRFNPEHLLLKKRTQHKSVRTHAQSWQSTCFAYSVPSRSTSSAKGFPKLKALRTTLLWGPEELSPVQVENSGLDGAVGLRKGASYAHFQYLNSTRMLPNPSKAKQGPLLMAFFSKLQSCYLGLDNSKSERQEASRSAQWERLLVVTRRGEDTSVWKRKAKLVLWKQNGTWRDAGETQG